jgi:Flp pilus assembly protein TadD
MRNVGWLLGSILGASVATAQMPAGAHSADDHSREDAANAQIATAESLLEHGDFKGAADKLKELAANRPNDARVLYDLGFADERIGADADAAKAYASAIEANAELPEPRLALGLLDARAGRTEAAHRELMVVAKMEGAAPELRARALRALAGLDEVSAPADASEELLDAIKLTGETPADVAMSAEIAARSGDPEDAETAYRRALKLRPDDVDAAAGLAQALQSEKKLPEAESVLNQALQAKPGDVRLEAQLASLYAAEDKASAAIPLLEALRGTPKYANDANVTRLLARVYAMNGDNAKAEPLYVALTAASPDDPKLLDDLGSVLVKEQKYAAAEVVFTKAVGMRTEFHDDAAWGEAAGHLGFASNKNGHPQVTLQALSTRARVLPDSPAVLFLRAISLDSLRRRKDAILAYRAFLATAGGKYPDEEFQARHRLVALGNEK